jgi:ABC-type sugar transport system ATPase subunit
MPKLLNMRGICKSFYGVEVLHRVDLEVEKGEIRALCGENGAGKSTLMRCWPGSILRTAGMFTSRASI